jgi:aspartate/methionine/tyrosine aminotransferase
VYRDPVVGEERVDPGPVSRSMRRIGERARDFAGFFEGLSAALAEAGPDVSDFSAGDPHDPPLEGYGEALRSVSRLRDPRWYAYTMNDPDAQAAAAAGLNDRLGTAFRPEDVLLTNAAIAGLAVTLRAVCDEGDKVILISPPHFLYEPMVLAGGATAVRVPVREEDLDLDVEGIAAAMAEAGERVGAAGGGPV